MPKLPLDFPLTSADPPTLQGLRQSIRNMYLRIVSSFNYPQQGTTALRPAAQQQVGDTYFDTTLGIPIWWNGTIWVNSAGTPV